jgi:hypothetical protein
MRVPPCRLAVLLFVAALAWPVGAAVIEPTVIDARDAADYVGSTVTVEGDVASARLEPIGMVLELEPVGPTSFRAVLVEALLSTLPRAPERNYQGKRVRITGLLQRFKGRPEIVLESRSQIEVVDLAGAPVTTTTTTAPTSRITSTTTVIPTVAPSPPPSAAPSPPPATVPTAPSAPFLTAPVAPPSPATTVPPPTTPPSEPDSRSPLGERLAIQACERARSRWREAAARVRAAAEELTRCLDAESFACHAPAAQMAPAIADLEWAEQQVAERCE